KTSDIPKVGILVPADFKDHFRMPDTQLVNLVKPRSNPKIIRPKNEDELICSNRPKREYNQGTTVKDTKKDNPVEIITVTQNCAKMLATNPVETAIGK